MDENLKKENADDGNGMIAVITLSLAMPPTQSKRYLLESCVIPAKTMKFVNISIEETASKTMMVERAHSAFPNKEWIVPHCLVNVEGKHMLTRINPWVIDDGTEDADEVCGTLGEVNTYLPEEIKKKMTSQAKITEEQKIALHEMLDKYAGYAGQAHRIDTGDARPISARPRRVFMYERQIVVEQVKNMLSKGIIEPSNSLWSANVVLIKKKDDVYPMPQPDDRIQRVAGAVIFSSMDIKNAFWQVPVHPEDREKTAFVTTDGLYQFKYLPFGLCNSPATFVRIIDHALLSLKWTHSSYYRRFIGHFALMAAPLHQLLKKEVPWEWKPEHQLAMRNIQDALLAAPTLAHDDEDGELVLKTDASKFGLGAVLNHVKEKVERLIIFISRRTSKAEITYHSNALEFLALVWALDKLKPYVYGRNFTVFTDNSALKWL
ncbi:hypothetical protein GHT06_021667 [Daphnia sinensis]|uniref:Reverse transcriptase/retrotransposon-derived protein RNase H-like domain-containing protein n=1 Tax=Daphnia sinensis TaxID=1820382 RepID=A0AAD5KJF5_9CRUS|nr:hypothetical protein GHT06_021667 [Daphnia sinensis]